MRKRLLTFSPAARQSLHSDTCDCPDDGALGMLPADHIRQIIRDFLRGGHTSLQNKQTNKNKKKKVLSYYLRTSCCCSRHPFFFCSTLDINSLLSQLTIVTWISLVPRDGSQVREMGESEERFLTTWRLRSSRHTCSTVTP